MAIQEGAGAHAGPIAPPTPEDEEPATGATKSPSPETAARAPSTAGTVPATARGPAETASKVIPLGGRQTGGASAGLRGLHTVACVQVGDIVRVIFTPGFCARLTGWRSCTGNEEQNAHSLVLSHC